MKIESLKPNQKIKIIDVSLIKQGEMLWENGDVVEVKDVEIEENRIEVWDKNKFLTELIYEYEFQGITTL